MNTLDAKRVEIAAKELAARFDYPWDAMPEQGRNEMRKNVRDIVRLATGPEKSQWIPRFSEKLPVPGKRYLVARECWPGTWEDVEIGYMWDGEWYMDRNMKPFTYYGYRITRWMPMPEPPKKGGAA